jgi:hypothetical protein
MGIDIDNIGNTQELPIYLNYYSIDHFCNLLMPDHLFLTLLEQESKLDFHF